MRRVILLLSLCGRTQGWWCLAATSETKNNLQFRYFNYNLIIITQLGRLELTGVEFVVEKSTLEEPELYETSFVHFFVHFETFVFISIRRPSRVINNL